VCVISNMMHVNRFM